MTTAAPWRITLADVVLDERERAAVDAVLRSGWLSMGPRTEAFEAAFAERIPGHAVAVTNGTAALHLAAAALGIGPGDEVICPTLTFVASAAAMVQAGATVRLADSTSLDDFSLDPGEIERLVTPKTKAVVVVHYGGAPADMAAIRTAAEKHGLTVIEDAAHALGSALDGVPCGSLGDAGCFSFFPNKNLTTGEGGMTVFRGEHAAERARLLRSHGMTALTWDRHRGHATGYDVVEFGFNYRIDEPRAALGLVQLARLDDLSAIRAELVSRYRENLAGCPFTVPTLGDRGISAHHLAVALAPSLEERDRARERLRERRIQTSVHYPPIHLFSRYRSEGERLANAEEIADRVVTLPLHPKMTERDVDEVCASLREV
ncbi:MAG TPA: DegT/DnrJ/EryC1/StrS family aminotransferase [Gaiellaceae bacterium]|nr:DegT/DnrJ/EryC1/StrS family aminotransferase [Gaiellaceae bacterium]